MKVDFSKSFEKSVQKLSGKMLDSVRNMIKEVKEAQRLGEITDCKKIVGCKNIYRIRIGDYRAFFVFHIEIIDDIVFFAYLVQRGEPYGKKMEKSLRRIDS